MTDASDNFPRLRTVVLADSVLAQPAFEILLQGGWVIGLVTTNRPLRGDNLRHLAQLANIPILQTSRTEIATELLPWLLDLQPDVLLTFTFPYRLPLEIVALPRLGAFNVHGGKLPEYRGPQPVFWQLRNGESEGAVTVHRMDEEFDRGAIVVSHTIPLAPEDTYGLHSARLAFTAVKVIEALFGGLIHYGTNLPTMPQDEARANFQPRPTPEDLWIRWDEQTGTQIQSLIKACNPWNQGAFTSIRGINLRLTDVTLLPEQGNTALLPGTILTAAEQVIVNCRDGAALQIEIVSMDEGILPGKTLALFGIQAGEQFALPSQL